MLIQNGQREDYIHALINTWLKDPSISCAYCGADKEEGVVCCEFPLMATNRDILLQHFKEIEKLKTEQMNEFASTKGHHMRFGVSLPVGLYMFLERAMGRYDEKLFTKKYPMTWFARKFPKFAIPEKI